VPFLRVIRDKRGYETTYLMDWYREGGRQRSRILYAFRGPSGARVGREAIGPETARAIEAQHADVIFDWAAILAERQIIESAPEPRRRRPRAIDAPGDTDAPEEEVVEPEVIVAPPQSENAVAAPVALAVPAMEVPRAAPPQATRAHAAFPAAIEGATPVEQIAFLEQWYPMIRDRILVRASDPERQQALLSLAERLNSSGWTDTEAIAAGLSDAAEALQRLALVFARRRRSRRRGPSREAPPVDSHSPS
jgi:hypothetical protein